ncbi:MAG: aminoglycoside phosphotransferase family protein [Chloroflexi bacterium]|nr:aminoglycoside phosphotransferase family protein [Chloroflexota bacterium]
MSGDVLVPRAFARTVLASKGGQARDWLARLPGQLQQCRATWQLQISEPFPGARLHFVAPATLPTGQTAVLKIYFPTGEYRHEVAALRHWNGHGCAFLLGALDDAEALLLERVEPGSDASALAEDEAIAAAAHVMQHLWTTERARHPFPTVAEWGSELKEFELRTYRGGGMLPVDLMTAARRAFDDLTASAAAPVVLHGDLHHFNLLQSHRAGWLAIDPKGVLGEPAYEVGAFIRNPPGIEQHPHLQAVLRHRIDQFSQLLALPEKRLLGWAFAQTALATWWTLDGGDLPSPAVGRMLAVLDHLRHSVDDGSLSR